MNKVLVDGVKITLNSNNQYSFVVEKNIKVTIECDLIPEPTHYTLTVKTEDEGVAQGGVGINKESNLELKLLNLRMVLLLLFMLQLLKVIALVVGGKMELRFLMM